MANHYVQMSSDQKSVELGDMITILKDDDLPSEAATSAYSNAIEPVFENLRTKYGRRVGLERILMVLTFLIVLVLLILLSILLGSSYNFNKKNTAISDPPCLTFSCLQAAVDITKSLNTSVDPCTDFSEFVCGRWKSDQILPEGTSRYSTFDVVNDKLYKVQKKLLENQDTKGQSSSWAKAINLYNSCLNVEKINMLGKTPLINQINKIYGKYGGWEMLERNISFFIDQWKLQELAEDPNVETPVFSLSVEEDDKNSKRNIFKIHLTRLMLERKFLRNTSIPGNQKIIDAYKEYMRDVGKLLGVSPTKFDQFNDVMALEEKIALKHPNEEDLRDPDRMYNKMTLSNLQSEVCPMFNWREIIRKRLAWVHLNLTTEIEVIITVPENLKQICTLFHSYTSDPKKNLIIHNYIMWRFVQSNVNLLSEDFLKAKEKFGKVYVGTVGSKQRWEICIKTVQSNMGIVLGNVFITQHFNKRSKSQVLEMINLLKEKFRQNLQGNKWMDSSTLKEAIKKIESMWPIVGYPESILNVTHIEEYYSQVAIDNETFYENIFQLNEKALRMNYESINKTPENFTIDTPQEVNAFYNPKTNEIIFPAGILQRPLFDPGFPRSLKYGGIGSVMGHEITHGFDDSGSKFDSRGKLRSWWTNETRNMFKSKSECFVKQYSKFSLDGHSINGENTLGENIADNGGLRLTYQVYKNLEKSHGVEKPLPGLEYSHDQLFFISFARLWCGLQTRQSTLIDIFSNSHTPFMFRVKGALSNTEEFAEAFNCPIGSPMNPREKCLVW